MTLPLKIKLTFCRASMLVAVSIPMTKIAPILQGRRAEVTGETQSSSVSEKLSQSYSHLALIHTKIHCLQRSEDDTQKLMLVSDNKTRCTTKTTKAIPFRRFPPSYAIPHAVISTDIVLLVQSLSLVTYSLFMVGTRGHAQPTKYLPSQPKPNAGTGT